MPRTGLHLLHGLDPAQIAASPFDVRVVSPRDPAGIPWTRGQVARMGGGPADPHLLLAYLSIGEADLGAIQPTAPRDPRDSLVPHRSGQVETAFWSSNWQAWLMRAVATLVRDGYDGVYLDGVEACRTVSERGRAALAASGQTDPAAAMIDLVTALAGAARARNPAFKVWAGNGEALLGDDRYLAAIDGLFRENLYYTAAGERQPVAATRKCLRLLQRMLAAGKDVIAIEQVGGAAQIDDVHAQAERDGLGSYVTRIKPARPAPAAPARLAAAPKRAPAAAPARPSAAAAGAGPGAPPRPTPRDRQQLAAEGPRNPAVPSAGSLDAFNFRPELVEALAQRERGAASAPRPARDAALSDPMALYLQRLCGADHPAFAA
ncbi:endo alpha-1,4 polygalactosaminidase [Methylobacterium planeticum]|uniref:Glycoside-hydrolase family GH114 TIM-barrel domain-containing protein n=1 Tax=Methylobacterium planeticum TaxID=2615211 RepID=A0A6N6MY11_9HYPH|nr:endo alpha-1,4 polygalactosaminidase [Methylobacterium planeticum]KAB1076168.1 hypothetical protein F6X51_01095 [Methylobacterium planeticum]